MATIPLAKGFNVDKLKFPAYLSRKIDGVPVCITVKSPYDYSLRTRQGKFMHSIDRLAKEFLDKLYDKHSIALPHTMVIVGEVHQRGKLSAPFKETSGIVRRQIDQSDQLAIAVFDVYLGADLAFMHRWSWMSEYLTDLHEHVSVVHQLMQSTDVQLQATAEEMLAEYKEWEGLVARSAVDLFEPGKRSWGYQKILPKPTADLWIIGCKEAISEIGAPLGMAGRLIAEYNGLEIGVGPGKLTHKERVALWEYFNQPLGGKLLAEVGYKKDPSYTALREPRFLNWRHDKDQPNV